jgi:hypothetical protein
MNSHVKQLVLLSLLNIAAVVSKVSSSLETTRIYAFIFWYHINKIHTQRSNSLLTAKIITQPSIQLCVASVAVQSGKHTFTVRTRDFPGLFNIHVSSEHRPYCDSSEMRKIFQLLYGAMNQSSSQQMCQCVATGSIALYPYAVQQCGCRLY